MDFGFVPDFIIQVSFRWQVPAALSPLSSVSTSIHFL